MKYKHRFTDQSSFIYTLSLLLILQTSCSTNVCNDSEGKILQVYETEKEVLKTFLVDHGASGTDVTLAICKKADNLLIEKIGLRGEDYLPAIDSVVGRTVYIHYSFPVAEKLLDFKAVALGDALLFPEKLKYKYIIWNEK